MNRCEFSIVPKYAAALLLFSILCADVAMGQADFDMIKPDGFFTEKKFYASDANQGVAVDENYFYPVNNTSISKHDRITGEALISKNFPGMIHFDGAVAEDGVVYAAHCNMRLPLNSTIEMYLAEDLSAAGTINLGEGHGALVWVDRHDGFWWICYAHYDGSVAGYPDIGNEATALVKCNDNFEELQLWYFPSEIINKFGVWSASGGSWGPDDLLYVSGHDLSEIYGVRAPDDRDTLEYIKTVFVESQGQGIAWDRSQTAAPLLLTIKRGSREVVFNRYKSLPYVKFGASDTSILEGAAITFSDSSANNPLSRIWLFPGGVPETGTAATPQVTYNSAGIYDVTLIVTNQYGSDTLVKTGYIEVKPGAVWAPPPIPGRGGFHTGIYENSAKGTIQFIIETADTYHTTVTLRNLMGKSISTVYSGILGPGEHVFTWNKADHLGISHQNFPYFAEITVGKEKRIQRINTSTSYYR